MDEQHNPWTVNETTVPYENPWIRVEHNEVTNPAGKPGIYGVVHFKNLALGCIALDEEDHIWLVGQYRFPLNVYSWEIPEGGGSRDTDPLVSIQRELEEECGLRASNWTLIQEMDLSNSVSDERGMIWLATGLSQGVQQPEETEQLKIKRVPFNEALKMVLAGEIRDSLSVAGILKLEVLRRNASL